MGANKMKKTKDKVLDTLDRIESKDIKGELNCEVIPFIKDPDGFHVIFDGKSELVFMDLDRCTCNTADCWHKQAVKDFLKDATEWSDIDLLREEHRNRER
jgi:hypothetical protein